MSHWPEQPAPRSPLFETLHTNRYQRQALIRDIEQETARRLLVYFANVNHPASGINQIDVAPFQDMLLDCNQGDDIDLLLQTPGGDIDTAEKLVYMLRNRAAGVRVIVTERAKSAGTLIALAADTVVMSSMSELGPIDPQVTITGSDGKTVNRPARSFLDGLEDIKHKIIQEGGINPAYYPLLSQLDPALLDYCEKASQRSEQFAEKWLRKYMLKDVSDEDQDLPKAIAEKLGDVKQYSSHGMVIDRDEAKDLGLDVTALETDDPLWAKLWRLHLAFEVQCIQAGSSKIFESRKVSLAM